MTFKSYLCEMAMQTGEGLALLNENNAFLVLFKPDYRLKIALKKQDTDLIEQFEDHIVGAISIRDNTLYKSAEVDRVYAQQGYGPLLYILAMCANGHLMSSRVYGQVSDDAKGVWQNFDKGVGKNLVNRQSLKVKHHDEDYLNKKYKLKQSYPMYEKLLKKGNAFFMFDTYGEMRNSLMELAEVVLHRKVNTLYEV